MRCVFEHESHEFDESLFVSFVLFVFKNNDLRQPTFEVRTKNYELRSWAPAKFSILNSQFSTTSFWVLVPFAVVRVTK